MRSQRNPKQKRMKDRQNVSQATPDLDCVELLPIVTKNITVVLSVRTIAISRCGWILEKSCQPAAETPDEKQQEDHSGDLTEMVKHLRNTDKIPDAWPEDLKDIPYLQT